MRTSCSVPRFSQPITSDRSEVSAREMENLPVALGRNYQQLFKTLPGFAMPQNAHSVPTNPSRALAFNVNGSSRSSNKSFRAYGCKAPDP